MNVDHRIKDVAIGYFVYSAAYLAIVVAMLWMSVSLTDNFAETQEAIYESAETILLFIIYSLINLALALASLRLKALSLRNVNVTVFISFGVAVLALVNCLSSLWATYAGEAPEWYSWYNNLIPVVLACSYMYFSYSLNMARKAITIKGT